MSHRGGDREPCEAYRADLAELSLGVLGGEERALLLEHLASCDRCGAELEQLTLAADAMLELSAEAEPPLGFEQRLVERLRGTPTARSPWRARRFVLAAAAVLLVAAGVGVGVLVAPRPASAPATATGRPAAARLTSAGGKVRGEVFLAPGHPAWLFMTLGAPGTSGVVRCTVTLASGKVETVGSVHLSGGYGAWGGTLAAPLAAVRSVRVVSAAGKVLATAAP